MDTDEAIRRLEERLAKRLDDARKEDRDIRHARNAAQDRLTDTLQVRITALEQSCREQETQCEKTATAVHRLVAAMQGDQELGSDGHIKRTTDTLKTISDQISKLESDRTESRTHRQNHADLPMRVTNLENRVNTAETKVRTVGWIAGLVPPIVAGVVTGLYWLRQWIRGDV